MNSNSFIRVQVRVRVQKKYFFEFKFESGKMIEFFQVRVRVQVQVRVRSPGWRQLFVIAGGKNCCLKTAFTNYWKTEIKKVYKAKKKKHRWLYQ